MDSPAIDHSPVSSPQPPRLGIRSNLPQFSLLVLVNAFVGAMVGMERSILPLIGEQEFGIASRAAIGVVALVTLISGVIVAIVYRG